MKIRLHLFILFLILAQFVSSQDLHFSQFYSTPLMINPANTGRFKEDTRCSFIHRRQWAALNSDFISTAFSTDMNFRTKWLKKDKIGVGLLFFHDDLAQGTIKTSSIYLSGAYHRMLDQQRRHRLSGGVQFGFNQKSINDQYFRFPNQYPSFVFDRSVGNNENLANMNYGFLDAQMGLSYTFVWSEKTEIVTGVSFYQLRQPKESIFKSVGSNNTLGTRWIYTVGLNKKLNDRWMITPTAMYMRQSKGRDLNLGGFVTYNLRTDFIAQLTGGVFARVNDAAIFMIGGRYKNIDAKFSYDATMSGVRNIRGADDATSKAIGAYELSINFYGLIPKNHPNEYTVPCGIF